MVTMKKEPNTCASPLGVIWVESKKAYMTNRELDPNGLYVDKEIADYLLETLKKVKSYLEVTNQDDIYIIRMIEDGMKQAQGDIISK